ncbi:MAG: carboxypeptidase regulatory-like domain-containing protein [Chloroflexi bacterium]|nr:carboxypeptidase regulatory-like domain-containing protein [Chloroflexota bacterium]
MLYSRWSFKIFLILGLLMSASQSVHAQSAAPVVTITTPLENETFYAGPYSLVYSIDVAGWVATNNPEPTLVRVQLDVLSGNRIAQTATMRLRADGSFSFGMAINPDAPAGEFSPDQRNCDACHYLANVVLPRGKVTLRITALEPNGNQAIAERHIIVDRSGFATVPIQVVRADNPQQPVPEIPVNGSTRIYMWRTRHYAGVTDPNGRTQLRVETLSQAPTHYVVRVEPSVVNGVLFESIEPITVTLAPGATAHAPITLRVQSRVGEITGKINPAIKPITVRAIRLTDGASYATQTTPSGAFTFANIAIAPYLIIADARALAEQGFASTPQTIDLATAPSSSITLPLVATSRGNAVSGILRDARGAPLPFAWVAIDQAGIAQSNTPASGAYSLDDVPRETFTLVASAPGYYHQAQVVDGTANQVAHFALTRRPETQTIAWGSGEIIAPPESQVRVNAHTIALDYGWLWGSGDTPPVTIRVADATITLPAGKFALEFLPERPAWLYVMEGVATVRSSRGDATVRGGEMLMLSNSTYAVPHDAFVIAALHPTDRSPIALTWEPTLEARARDQLAQMGINVAQVTTFVTYFAIVFVLILTPLWLMLWWWRQNKNKIGV